MESVIRNLRPRDEYFVIDGGSTDRSVELIRRHAAHLTGWVSEPDQGYADALAKGFERASGDILCWVNASDVLLPGALDAVRATFLKYDVDMIYGDVLNIDEQSRVLHTSKGGFPCLKYYMLYGGGAPWQIGCFWRREAYEAVGGIRGDMRLAADYEFFLRLSLSRSVCYIPTTFGAHRQHGNQLSVAQAREYKQEKMAARRRTIKRLRQNSLTQFALASIFWPYARTRARLANFISRWDRLRGEPLAEQTCK